MTSSTSSTTEIIETTTENKSRIVFPDFWEIFATFLFFIVHNRGNATIDFDIYYIFLIFLTTEYLNIT